MNLLDENIREDQRGLLQHRGIPAHQIGVDVGRQGMQDEEIIPFLHTLRDTTFYTRDLGFSDRKLCHRQYCLVCLAVGKEKVAVFIRRVLRHPAVDKVEAHGYGNSRFSRGFFYLASKRDEGNPHQLG